MLRNIWIKDSRANENDEAIGFWKDIVPCWKMCHCPTEIKEKCPAFQYPILPCWEIEGTYLKLGKGEHSGVDITTCKSCRVYKRYGNDEPIHIRLRHEYQDLLQSANVRKSGYMMYGVLSRFIRSAFHTLSNGKNNDDNCKLNMALERR